MNITMILITIFGLCLFETVSSIDNAIINAEVLGSMGKKARRFFLTWGIFFAVFVARGLLPWAIVWASIPSLGPIGAFTAAFSNDPSIHASIEQAAPVLLMGGGTFLVLLFMYWLFIEPKNFGIKGEKFFYENGVWFYAASSVFLAVVVWFSLKNNQMAAFSAVIGSTAFFITNGFKANASEQEQKLMKKGMPDLSKLLYLEIIDLTFSIDGVLGAFAFTLSVPLIIIGNGLGALVVRQITIKNVENIKNYRYLKNGAMYSILFLGAVMCAEGFGVHVPEYVSPLLTVVTIAFFFVKSIIENRKFGYPQTSEH